MTEFNPGGAASLNQAVKLRYEANADTNAYSDTEKAKLAGVAAGASANAADAVLTDRANHSGSQAIATVAGLQAALDGTQPLDATLTALAGLSVAPGLVEQTGADSFAKRALGVAGPGDIPTRGEADARYAALAHTHTATQISDSTLAGRALLTAPDAAAQSAQLAPFSATAPGVVPASGGGSVNFLRADGTWATPAGGGGGQAFPVGAVFLSVVATDPATLLGYGSWVAFGAGRMLVGVDAGDPDFALAEETGGAKTHTLTEAQLPAHTHAVSDPGHNHVETNNAATTGITLGATGGGAAVNHMPPHIAVHMWKRTA